MLAARVSNPSEGLLDPEADAWGTCSTEMFDLTGVSVEQQPSRYVRSIYAGERIGRVRQLAVQVAYDGDDVFFRLEWPDADENLRHEQYTYPDGAAVLVPLNGSAPLQTMGSPEEPVGVWYWRPDLDDQVEQLTARGLGTVERRPRGSLQARSRWQDGRWQVVMRRAMRADAPDSIDMKAATPARVAFAIWAGSAGERAGIKSYSRVWRTLEWGPPASAGGSTDGS